MTIKLMLFVLVFSSICALYVILQSATVSAADRKDWVTENIISDTTFTDKDSMSTEQIQSFLNREVGNCDTWGTGIATEFGSSKTRAQYAASRGWDAPPYICLNNYYEVPKTTPSSSEPVTNFNKSASIPNGSKSAAWIIKDAANRYNISPKVLLVKIATESAGPLTNDKWPLFSQYRYAMGSNCPDSGPGGSANCDTSYAGFSIQMYSAAALMRSYLDNMDEPWWSLKRPGNGVNGSNYVGWNVAPTGCGGTNLNIKNKATAALYTYTPYQPNNAALSNLYGSGDRCSAYGNRNFWRVFTDWFGSGRETPFFKISGSGKVYMRGINSSYYYVTKPALLRDYGMDSKFNRIDIISENDASTMSYSGPLPNYASFEGDEIYAVSDAKISHFKSRARLESDYGLDITKTAQLTESLKYYYTDNGEVNQVLALSDGDPVYYVANGEKRHISSASAFRTLGSPVYSSAPRVNLSSNFAASLTDGAPIVSENTVLRANDTNKKYYWGPDDTLYSLSHTSASQLAHSYSARDELIAKLSTSPVEIERVVQSDTGKSYLLENGFAAIVSSSKADTITSEPQPSVTIPNELLSKYKQIDTTAKFVVFNNGQTIYLNDGYKLYQIYNRAALYSLGGTFEKVKSIPEQFKLSLYEPRGYQLAPNQLFQINGSGRVYVAGSDRNAYHILSTDLAKQYSISLTNIARLPSSLMSEYHYATLRRYSQDSAGRVWLFDRSSRIELDSAAASRIGIPPSQISVVSDAIISRLPIKNFSPYAADVSTGKVYLIENGEKRWYTSRKAFESQANWSQIVDYSSEFMSTLPTGSPIR